MNYVQRFDIAADIAAIQQFDIIANMGNIEQIDIAASIGNVEQIDVSGIINSVQTVVINSQIGVISTTLITLTARIAMTDKVQINVIAPIRLIQQNTQTIQIGAIIRLLNEMDSVVIDLQKPEAPIYGQYQ